MKQSMLIQQVAAATQSISDISNANILTMAF